VSVTLVHVCGGGPWYTGAAWLVGVLAAVPVPVDVVSGPEESARTTAVVWGVPTWLTETATAAPIAARASDAATIRVAGVSGVNPARGACGVELRATQDALLSVFAAQSAALTC
jgi:hypothetical protein